MEDLPPEEAPNSLDVPLSRPTSPAASAAAAAPAPSKMEQKMELMKYADFKKSGQGLRQIKFLRLLVKELATCATRDAARPRIREVVAEMNEDGFFIDVDNPNERQTVAVLTDLSKYLTDNPREHLTVRDGLLAMLTGGPELDVPKVRSFISFFWSLNHFPPPFNQVVKRHLT
jgi:hypothetical protein